MSEATLNEPMTAYLAFKVALKQGDEDTALRCLKQISGGSTSNPQYLYACCLEAQQAQDKIITIEALRHLVLKHQQRQSHWSSSTHLPSLLRVLIRLEVSILNDGNKTDTDRETLVGDLCNIFKAGKTSTYRHHICKPNQLYSRQRDTEGEKR